MKILVLIHEFPPVGGGGGRAAQELCERLAERRHQITVITSYIKGLDKVKIFNGMQLIRVPAFRHHADRASFISMAWFLFSAFWAASRLIRETRPDIIHVHFAVPAGVLAWVLSSIHKIPYLLTIHLGDVPGGVPEKTDKWFKWIFPLTFNIWRDAGKIIAVSEFTRNLAMNHYDVPIEVIPNGVEITPMNPDRVAVNFPVRLIFAGRFVHQKNPIEIIDSLYQIKDLDWRCTLLGDGPLMGEIKSRIERTGLRARFDLPGWVSSNEVISRLAGCDILFMPSFSEGLPVVGIQALGKGLAMLVSNIGGFQDIAKDGVNGYLVEARDHEKFAQKLRTLITDRDNLREFRKMSLRMAVKFDIQHVVDSYEAALVEAAHGN